MDQYDDAQIALEAQEPDPTAGPLWLVSFIGAVLVLVISLGLIALYQSAEQQVTEQKFVGVPFRSAETVREEQEQRLTAGPRWVEVRVGEDEIARELAVPIEMGIERVVETYGGQE